MNINWDHSGVGEVSSILSVINPGVSPSVDYIKSRAESFAKSTYSDDGCGYIETAGFCVTLWKDLQGQIHAKVTLSYYGVGLYIWKKES